MNIMGHLQQLGRSLMLPTIVLPGAAIFLSLSALPWAAIGIPSMHDHLQTAGEALFSFLPYLFAFGVAMGMTSNAGTAGLAALPVCLFIQESSTPAIMNLNRLCLQESL